MTLGAVLHGHLEGLEKGPVVIDTHELLETAEESVDERVFLFLGLRLLNIHRDGVVEDDILFAGGVGELCVLGLILELVEGRRKGNLFEGIDLCQGFTRMLPHILDAVGLFHLVWSSKVTSSQLFLPSALICGADHEMGLERSSSISFSCLPPLRLGSSPQRMEW